jgi:hypothetical protein
MVPKPAHRAEQGSDTCGFFVFDCRAMNIHHDAQAFGAIYDGLRASSGMCAFHDGIIFSCESVREITRRADLVEPSSPHNPLGDLEGTFDFDAYFVAMWTDTYRNFGVLHDALVAAWDLRGYLGYMTRQGKFDGDVGVGAEMVAQEFIHQLHLPASITWRDGAIVRGTSESHIALHLANSALSRAAGAGEFDDVMKAIAFGADVNCIVPLHGSSSPIIHAASNGHADIVKVLLANGANPNAQSKGGTPALMLASWNGHLEVVKTLIAGGVEVNSPIESRETALDKARDYPDIQVVLRAAGARR